MKTIAFLSVLSLTAWGCGDNQQSSERTSSAGEQKTYAQLAMELKETPPEGPKGVRNSEEEGDRDNQGQEESVPFFSEEDLASIIDLREQFSDKCTREGEVVEGANGEGPAGKAIVEDTSSPECKQLLDDYREIDSKYTRPKAEPREHKTAEEARKEHADKM